jgi:hypothetical protein
MAAPTAASRKFNNSSWPGRKAKARVTTAEAVFALKFRSKRLVDGTQTWSDWSWVNADLSEWHPVTHWWRRTLMTQVRANDLRGRLLVLGFEVKVVTVWRKIEADL